MKSTLSFVFAFVSSAALACPFCSTKTATEIRASLFGPDFFGNLIASLLPFAVFYLIVLAIYKDGWRRKSA